MYIAAIEKGLVTKTHDGISATATGEEIDVTGFNAALVSVEISGTGTWKIDVQGRLDGTDAFKDLYDNNNNQLTTGNLTASRTKLFAAIPNSIRIVATEIDGAATCAVRVQPINV
jgi:hypothetical protein